MASSVEKDEVVSLELPAPPGWKKKVSFAFPRVLFRVSLFRLCFYFFENYFVGVV